MKINLRKYLPRAFNISEPVVQFFVNKDGINTYYSFTNFPSFYSPQTSAPYNYQITIYDMKGKKAAQTEINVAKFGTEYFNPVEYFKGKNLPEVGMLTALIKPKSIFFNKDKVLGKLTSHFFVFFSSANGESLGVIHPQARIKKPKKNPNSWRSNQIIETRNLKKIVSLQLNPTKAAASSKISITDLEGNEIESQQNILAPFGVAENVWSNFGGKDAVSFKIDKMTSPNAKPLLFVYFNDGSFTVSHS